MHPLKHAGIITAIAYGTTTANAGIQWESSTRFLAAGNNVEFDLEILEHTGAAEFSVGVGMNHPNSRASIKVTNDSMIGSNTYKNTSTYHLQNGPTNSGREDSGASSNLSSVFTINQTTTIQIHSVISGFFQPTRDGYRIIIENIDDNLTVLELNTPPTVSAGTLELSAGSYRFRELHEMIGVDTIHPQMRSFGVFTTITVVPTPSTLAMLSPIGLLATRRRR